MIARVLGVGVACLAMSLALAAQTKTVPRPPAGQPPAGDSAAPDGYQPLPQWLGQTRAPAPGTRSAFTVAAFASRTNGAGFQFLPDGRILLGERNGVIRIVGRDGKLSDPLAGMPPDMAKAGQSLFSIERDQRFEANRTIYFTYAVVPAGSSVMPPGWAACRRPPSVAAPAPRVVLIARAARAS